MVRLHLTRLACCAAVAMLTGSLAAQENEPVAMLPNAHAHNDYRHDRPLFDALERGFCSVEADIFLIDGELLVAHDIRDLRTSRTLQRLYLDPLREIVERNNGFVYQVDQTFTLLVDIKAEGTAVYSVLRDVLAEYDSILSGVDEGRFQQRAIQVVISGDRPFEEISADETRRVGVDGRLSDLDSDLPADLMPLISDRWSSHFSWRGQGEFPPDEQEKLAEIVRKSHERGRRVRFWATPEKKEVWQILLEAGVDHINTDDLDGLREFLIDQASQK